MFVFEDSIFNYIDYSNIIKIGDKLNFIAIDSNMNFYNIDNINNNKKNNIKYKIISVFLSIDTNICIKQTKFFNKKISFYNNVELISISKDLPFAQKRFLKINKIKNKNHIMLSDYNYYDFSKKTNLLIKEINLLVRSVLILDENNIVKYIEIVEYIKKEPNYFLVFDFLDKNL